MYRPIYDSIYSEKAKYEKYNEKINETKKNILNDCARKKAVTERQCLGKRLQSNGVLFYKEAEKDTEKLAEQDGVM